MAHTCHAYGCGKEIPASKLMCPGEWFSLPLAVRNAVWREYRKGQERTKTPSERYLAVFWYAVALTAPVEARSGLFDRAERRRNRAIADGAGDPLAGLVPS